MYLKYNNYKQWLSGIDNWEGAHIHVLIIIIIIIIFIFNQDTHITVVLFSGVLPIMISFVPPPPFIKFAMLLISHDSLQIVLS